MIAPYPLLLVGRRVVLASGSPRRRELLGLLGLEFDVVPADVDETPQPSETPLEHVSRLAAAKALAVARTEPADAIVIGSDTIVDVDDEILGKPRDADDARRMLRQLSGRTHLVHTAVAVAVGGATRVDTSATSVTMVELTDAEIEWYVGTGEPLDKAGAYGMQGHAGTFVSSVAGSVTGVLGLPLDVVVTLLRAVASQRLPSEGFLLSEGLVPTRPAANPRMRDGD